MKAITLTEPWASAVAAGFKRIETRSWRAPRFVIGQRIAIHAAKKITAEDIAFSRSLLARSAFYAAGVIASPNDDPSGGDAFAGTRGHVIATATLVDCVRFTAARFHGVSQAGGWLAIETNQAKVIVVDDIEHGFGDFSGGRFGFVLADVARCPEPIPARGALGFWDWTPPAEWKARAA